MLYPDTSDEISSIDTSDFEDIKRFYDETRRVLSGILGDRNLYTLSENFVYKTLPTLRQGFVDIGFESSDAEISKFQDMWAANPEIERIARIYLKLMEITEARLSNSLSNGKETFLMEFSVSYFSLWQAFHEVVDEEDLEPLSRGIGDEVLISLSDSQEYKRVASAFLEPIAKQSAPAECMNPEFP